MHCTLSGEIEYSVINSDGSIAAEGKHKNLVLDNGLNMLASAVIADVFKYCCVGTGTSTPIISQLGLDVERARTMVYYTATSYCGTSDESTVDFYKSRMKRTFEFGYGTLNSSTHGPYYEVGFSNTATVGNNLFSRALFKDGSGNPIGISITSTQQFRITYSLIVSKSKTTNITGNSVPITNFGTVPYIISIAALSISNVNTSGTSSGAGNHDPVSTGSAYLYSVAGTNIGTNTSSSSPTYSAGTFSRSTQYDWNTSTGNGPIYSIGVSTGSTFAKVLPNPLGTHTTALSTTLSADGASLYCTNNGSNKVSHYQRNITTGTLTYAGTVDTAGTNNNPYDVIVSPEDTHVYVTCSGDNFIYCYNRDINTGVLTYISTIPTGSSPHQIIITSDGVSVYCYNSVSGTISSYSRNISTGSLTNIGTTSAVASSGSLDGIVCSPDGLYVYGVYTTTYYSGGITIYSRNTSTGVLTYIGIQELFSGYHGWSPIMVRLTMSVDGISLYASIKYLFNSSPGYIVHLSRNLSTGILTAISSYSSVGGCYLGVKVSQDNAYVYCCTPSNTILKYIRNLTDGSLIDSGSVYTGATPQGISISSDGTSVYCANGGSNANGISVFTRDVSTGILLYNLNYVMLNKSNLYSLSFTTTKSWGRE